MTDAHLYEQVTEPKNVEVEFIKISRVSVCAAGREVVDLTAVARRTAERGTTTAGRRDGRLLGGSSYL
jgi:hypothetical protein